jgi:hypothetical protein
MSDQHDTADDGIPAIDPDYIFAEWQKGKSLRQIARELRVAIAVVMRTLKLKQKSVLQKGG